MSKTYGEDHHLQAKEKIPWKKPTLQQLDLRFIGSWGKNILFKPPSLWYGYGGASKLMQLMRKQTQITQINFPRTYS